MELLLACMKIFLGRIADVSIGTVRTIITVKGKTFTASFLAFFEVLIWYYVARSALNTNLTNIMVPISYSLGYATGTYLGSVLSKRFIKGNVSVQVITTKATTKNLKLIRDKGYGLTAIDIYDNYDGNNKKMLLLEIKNSSQKDLTNLIKSIDPSAFITFRETQSIHNGFIK